MGNSKKMVTLPNKYCIMSQFDYIKEIARLALANDQNHLREALYDFVDYPQKNNRAKFAAQLNLLSWILQERKKLGN